jgi:hypothetical protein
MASETNKFIYNFNKQQLALLHEITYFFSPTDTTPYTSEIWVKHEFPFKEQYAFHFTHKFFHSKNNAPSTSDIKLHVSVAFHFRDNPSQKPKLFPIREQRLPLPG